MESFEEKLNIAIKQGWRITNPMIITFMGERIDINQPAHCNRYNLMQYSILVTK